MTLENSNLNKKFNRDKSIKQKTKSNGKKTLLKPEKLFETKKRREFKMDILKYGI